MNDSDIQALLNDTSERLGVVGAQLAIFDRKRQREFATGYRNRELALPVTKETLFQIGSTTKLFNAALVMSLFDSGSLDIDAPVTKYAPGLRLADADAQRSLTLTHLLSMTGGLDNGTYHDYGRGEDALFRYTEALAGIPHIFAPGTAFGYSNASSNVAGHAAACVMGRTWEQSLTQLVWQPLGLKHSALFAEDMILHPVSLGYEKPAPEVDVARIPRWSMTRSMAPAGGLTCCSAGDLLAFARMFLDRGRAANGQQVLSATAVEKMHEPQVKLATRRFADEWCLGPYRKRWGEHVVYGHSGTNLGGSSTLLWCPDENVAVAIVVNVAAQGYPFATAIIEAVLPEVFNMRRTEAPSPRQCAVTATDLTPYVGRFESFGITLRFRVENGSLMLSSDMLGTRVERCELIPLGDHRFFPCDPRISGNRNWDIAFWGADESGRASHVLQGIFPLRRTA